MLWKSDQSEQNLSGGKSWPWAALLLTGGRWRHAGDPGAGMPRCRSAGGGLERRGKGRPSMVLVGEGVPGRGEDARGSGDATLPSWP